MDTHLRTGERQTGLLEKEDSVITSGFFWSLAHLNSHFGSECLGFMGLSLPALLDPSPSPLPSPAKHKRANSPGFFGGLGV